MKRKLIKIGNSLGITLPKEITGDKQAGDEIEVLFPDDVITKDVITKDKDVITNVITKPSEDKNVITKFPNVITKPSDVITRPKNNNSPCFCKKCQIGEPNKCLYKNF